MNVAELHSNHHLTDIMLCLLIPLEVAQQVINEVA